MSKFTAIIEKIKKHHTSLYENSINPKLRMTNGVDYSHPILEMTVEQMEAFAENMNKIFRGLGLDRIDLEKMTFTETSEQLEEMAMHIVRQKNGRKGFKVLEAKYGKEIAKKIISK